MTPGTPANLPLQHALQLTDQQQQGLHLLQPLSQPWEHYQQQQQQQQQQQALQAGMPAAGSDSTLLLAHGERFADIQNISTAASVMSCLHVICCRCIACCHDLLAQA